MSNFEWTCPSLALFSTVSAACPSACSWRVELATPDATTVLALLGAECASVFWDWPWSLLSLLLIPGGVLLWHPLSTSLWSLLVLAPVAFSSSRILLMFSPDRDPGVVLHNCSNDLGSCRWFAHRCLLLDAWATSSIALSRLLLVPLSPILTRCRCPALCILLWNSLAMIGLHIVGGRIRFFNRTSAL